MHFSEELVLQVTIYFLVSIGLSNGVPFSEKRVNANPVTSKGLTKAALECLKDTSVDQKIFFQIRHGKIEETDDVKDFFFCTFIKGGVGSDDGVVNPQKILELYPEGFDEAEVTKVLDMCIKQSEKFTVPKDRVYNFFKCFPNNTPTHLL